MNETFTRGSVVLVLCMMLSNFAAAISPPTLDTHANIWISLEHFRSQEPARFMALRIENEDGSLYAELDAHDLSQPISVPKGLTYYVTPLSYTGQKSRLVDVYTYVAAQRHILGFNRLSNMCDLMIGDNTRDGVITHQDMQQTKRRITKKDLSAEMKINFALKSGENCPEPRINEIEGQSIRQLIEVIEDDVYLEYVYNIEGDLGSLATIESMIPIGKTPLPNNNPVEVYLVTPDIFIEANQEYTIYFHAEADADLLACQFTPVIAGVAPQPEDTFMEDIKERPIRYTFSSTVAGQLRDLLTITHEYVDPVAYDVMGNRLKLGLVWETSSFTREAQLVAQLLATPNPFIDNTQLQLDITHADTYQIHIYDAVGKQLYNQKLQLTTGQHQILVPATTFDGAGMYFVKLSNGNAQRVAKLVKQ